MAGLADVAYELYGMPPEDFTATRDARARQARTEGDRDLAAAIKALRRPSAAAWAVNALVRAHPAEVERLLDLGEALREAQAALDGAELRALDKQQRQVLAAVRRRAQAVLADAGHRMSEAVARQVEQTLKAGMADAEAATAVRSGMLVTDLESTGFGPVDLTGAVAVEGPVGSVAARPGERTTAQLEPRGVARGRPAVSERRDARDEAAGRKADRRDAARRREEARREEARRREEERLEQARLAAQEAASEADAALAAAEAALATATTRAEEASSRRQALQAELHDLELRITHLRTAERDASRDEREARAAADKATRTEHAARRRAEEARKGLGRT